MFLVCELNQLDVPPTACSQMMPPFGCIKNRIKSFIFPPAVVQIWDYFFQSFLFSLSRFGDIPKESLLIKK